MTTYSGGIDMPKDVISFYQIAKELAEEDKVAVEGSDTKKSKVIFIPLVVNGKIQDKDQFDLYRKKRQEYLIEILQKADLFDTFKPEQDKKFQIPVSQKESIKFLLRHYTSPVSRKIRKNKIDRITTAEVKITVANLQDFINKNMSVPLRDKETATAYALSELQSRTAFDEVETGLLKLMEDDLSNVKSKPVSLVDRGTQIHRKGKALDKKLRIANDSDAAYLMYVYYKMLQQQSMLWNEIVDEIVEIRSEEIIEMLTLGDKTDSHAHDCEEAVDEASSDSRKYRDIREVLEDAQMRIIERRLEKSRWNSVEPSPEQKIAIENFLSSKK